MGYKIAILHQGFVPVYRERFFELLHERSCNRYVVFHGQPPSNTGHVAASGRFKFANVRVHNRELRLGSRTLIYQPVVHRILRGGFDAVVIGHEYKLVANQVLFAAHKFLRKPVLLWGHARHRANAHPLARTTSGLTARLADGYLVYTSGGAARLRDLGVSPEHISVLRNTIDIEAEIAAHSRLNNVDPESIKLELGLRPDAQTLIYIGRIYEQKCCDQLVSLVRRLDEDREVGAVDLVIVGNGPDLERVQAAAADLPNIHFVGSIYDREKTARLMRIAAAMVNPGAVGLAVNHCFAHGVPVITRDHGLHGPEVDYVQNGQNGFVVAGGIDEYVAAVRRVLVEPELLARLSDGALATRKTLSLHHMAKEFDCGVCRAIQRRYGPEAAIDCPG